MSNICADSFSGASGVALQTYNASWIRHPLSNNNNILLDGAGGLYNVTEVGTVLYTHSAVPPSADYKVSADYVFFSSVANAIAVAGRCSSTADTRYWARWDTATGWKLFKTVLAANTQLGSTVADTAFSSGTMRITLRMEGSTISVIKNNSPTPIISVTDNSISNSGYAGLRGYAKHSVNTGIHITNFSADTLDGGETSLSAISIVSGTPVIGSPAITQNHAISAQTITAGSPVLGTPSIPTDGNHELTAIGVESAPPVLGTPTLAQQNAMMAIGVTSAAPTLGTPTLVSVAPVGSIIWPTESDVRLGVAYGPTGTEYTGTMAGVGGTYPTAESIAAAVVAALQATTIPANIKAVNDKLITGGGVTGDSMRPV